MPFLCPKAAEHAAEIAAGLDATVVLYHVYEPEEFKSQLETRNIDSKDPAELARQNVTVEAVATVLKDAGVEFSVEASTGKADEELTEYINTHDIDHVLVGGRNRSPAGKAILGSVSQRVMLDSDVPCTLVR